MVAKLENLKNSMEKQGGKFGKLEQRKQVENLKNLMGKYGGEIKKKKGKSNEKQGYKIGEFKQRKQVKNLKNQNYGPILAINIA